MILVYSIQRWTTTKHWQKQSNMTRWITFIHSIDHWHMSTVCVTHVNWSTDMRRTHCPLLYCRHVMTWLQRYAVVFSRSFFSVPCTSQTTAYGTVGRHNTLHSASPAHIADNSVRHGRSAQYITFLPHTDTSICTSVPCSTDTYVALFYGPFLCTVWKRTHQFLCQLTLTRVVQVARTSNYLLLLSASQTSKVNDSTSQNINITKHHRSWPRWVDQLS